MERRVPLWLVGIVVLATLAGGFALSHDGLLAPEIRNGLAFPLFALGAVLGVCDLRRDPQNRLALVGSLASVAGALLVGPEATSEAFEHNLWLAVGWLTAVAVVMVLSYVAIRFFVERRIK